MHMLDIPRSLPSRNLQNRENRSEAAKSVHAHSSCVSWRLSPDAANSARYHASSGARIRRRPITQRSMSAKLTYEVMHASFADNGITSELEGL